MRFVIPRETWLRGDDGQCGSALYTEGGLSCCLGHIGAQACGVPRAALGGFAEPACILDEDRDNARTPDFLAQLDDGLSRNTALAQDAMAINDDTETDDAAREAKLAALFAEHGHDLVFVDTQAESDALLAATP